jgi:hypothetical protein
MDAEPRGAKKTVGREDARTCGGFPGNVGEQIRTIRRNSTATAVLRNDCSRAIMMARALDRTTTKNRH